MLSIRSCLFFLSFLFCFITVQSYTTYIRANDEICYHEDVVQGQKVVGSYYVAAGGMLDVDFVVKEQENKK